MIAVVAVVCLLIGFFCGRISKDLLPGKPRRKLKGMIPINVIGDIVLPEIDDLRWKKHDTLPILTLDDVEVWMAEHPSVTYHSVRLGSEADRYGHAVTRSFINRKAMKQLLEK